MLDHERQANSIHAKSTGLATVSSPEELQTTLKDFFNWCPLKQTEEILWEMFTSSLESELFLNTTGDYRATTAFTYKKLIELLNFLQAKV